MYPKIEKPIEASSEKSTPEMYPISMESFKEKIEKMFSRSEAKSDTVTTPGTLDKISLDDGTTIKLPEAQKPLRSPDEIFATFGYKDADVSASLTRSETDSKRDLFREFGFNPKDMLIGYRAEPQIIGSNNLDFWEAFDEYTDDKLYSSSRRSGPNCMAYAYGIPKELNGTAYKHKPCPGHFAKVDASEELSEIMEYGSPKTIKQTFEKYMTMDSKALGRELVEVSTDYQPKEGERMFALVTAPHIVPGFGSDFHFYVKGKNGFWSHKPGVTNPTIFDDAGKTIKDPSKCDRGIYTNFVGFYVMKAKNKEVA